MISKTESGRVSKEILGIGSGSGTRWALTVDSLSAILGFASFHIFCPTTLGILMHDIFDHKLNSSIKD